MNKKLILYLIGFTFVFICIEFKNLKFIFSSNLDDTPIIFSHKVELGKQSNSIQIPIQTSQASITLVDLDTWTTNDDKIQFQIENIKTKDKHKIATGSFLRHKRFNISSYIKPDQPVILHLNGTPSMMINRFTIRQTSNISRFPYVIILWLGLLTIYFAFSKPRKYKSPAYWVFPVILIGFAVRWDLLMLTLGESLTGDAIGYFERYYLPFKWSSPFQTGVREPLFIWIQSFISIFLGKSEMIFRLTTVLLSTSIMCVMYFLGTKMSGSKLVGLLSTVLLSLGNFSVFNSVRGERSELFVLVLLLMSLFLLKKKIKSPKNEVTLGILSACAGLVWLWGIASCGLAYCYRWIHFKIKFRNAVFYFVSLIVVALPFLISQYKMHKDPFHAINVRTNFYRNLETTGTPGYQGEKRNWLEYLILERSGSTIKDTFTGYFNLFLNPLNSFNKTFLGFHYTTPYSTFMFPFLIWGFIVSIREKNKWVFVLTLAFINISVVLMPHIKDPRLFLQVAPLFAYFWAVGLRSTIRGLYLDTTS